MSLYKTGFYLTIREKRTNAKHFSKIILFFLPVFMGLPMACTSTGSRTAACSVHCNSSSLVQNETTKKTSLPLLPCMPLPALKALPKEKEAFVLCPFPCRERAFVIC